MSDKMKKSIRRVKPVMPSEAVIEAIKRKKPDWCRSLIGRYPEFGVVTRTLKDGFKLVNAHHMDAKEEVSAFCVLNGVKEGTVLGPQKKTISLKRVLTPGKETSYAASQDAADVYLSKHFKFERSNLTETEQWLVNRKMKTYKSIREKALKKKRDSILGCLHNVRFRPAGWLLLGTKDEKELAKLVRVSFGQGAVNEMRLTRRLPIDSLQIVLARKNQVDYERELAEKLKRKAESAKKAK